MLSSPPPRFAALDERLRGRVEVVAAALDDRSRIVAVVDHRRQAVRAEQEDVARLAPRP